MRNNRNAASLALLVVAAASLSACSSTSTKTACYDAASQASCSISAGHIAAYGPVSAAPEVQAAEMLSSAAAAGIERTLAGTRPDLAFRAGLSATTNYLSYGGQPAGAAYSYALGLNVPLYQGGAEAALAVARAEHRVSQEMAADRRVAVAYEIAISLLTIRQQRDVIAVLDRQQTSLRGLRDGIDAELAAGAASRVDLDDADRQLARIAVLRETAKLALTQASTSLRRLGIADTSALPDVGGLGLGESRQALVQIALSNNPRIRQSAAQVDAATLRVSEAQGAMQPALAAQFEVYGEDIAFSRGPSAPGARATLQFSLPFDLSGAGQANIRQRNDQMQAAQFDSEAVRNGVSAAVGTAFDRRQQARQLRALAQREVDSATALLEGIQAERQIGGRTVLDEIRAIENLSAARINLVAAQFELRAAEYTLAAETGLIIKLFETAVQAAAL